MIYLILNVLVTIFLGVFTHLIDKKVKTNNIGVGSFSIAALLTAVEAFIFSVVLLLTLLEVETIILPIMKLIYSGLISMNCQTDLKLQFLI